jgi:hypothetical protein
MEKTLTIDGQEVRFKSTGAVPVRYKAQFHRDFFKDVLKMRKLSNVTEKKPEDITDEELEPLDLEVFYRIIWVLAKTADKDIPDLLTWLDSFEVFPFDEVMEELSEMISSSIQQSKKKSMTGNLPRK